MQKAPGRRPQYRRICRLLAPCLRGSSYILHNRRPVYVLFPKNNQGLFPLGNRVAGLPEVTRYHFLVKRKLCPVLCCYKNTASAQGIAEFDEAVRPFTGYIDDRYRGKMHALENGDVYEGILVLIGTHLNAAHSGFINNRIDDITEKRLNDLEFRMIGIEKPDIKCTGPRDLSKQADHSACDIGSCRSTVPRGDFCERRALRVCMSRAEAEESGGFRSCFLRQAHRAASTVVPTGAERQIKRHHRLSPRQIQIG